jgi:hypothetical protein
VYTNRITFGTDLSYEDLDPTTPTICDTQLIYETAKDLGLEEVKIKALEFLNGLYTIENVTERLFKAVTSRPEDKTLVDLYSSQFVKDWGKIRKTKEHVDYFKKVEGTADHLTIMCKFYDLMLKVDLKE